jgi:hypothetical protein
MKITTLLLFEANAKGLAVELATRGRLSDDRTEARDEQHLSVSDSFHGISCPHNELRSAAGTQCASQPLEPQHTFYRDAGPSTAAGGYAAAK